MTQIFKKLLLKYLEKNEQLVLRHLRRRHRINTLFPDLEKIFPPDGFEDLTWLFSCNEFNRGIVRLNFDEAAYLYKLVKKLKPDRVLEIGRHRGGSVVIIASALAAKAVVDSVDIKPENDNALSIVLNHLGLSFKANLIVGTTADLKNYLNYYNLIFIDGDHSYAGVSADYLFAKKTLKKNGCLVFHDYNENQPDVVRLVDEIEAKEKKFFQKTEQVGSMICFKKL